MKKETLLKILFFVIPWCIAAAFNGAAISFIAAGKKTAFFICFGLAVLFFALPIGTIIMKLGDVPHDDD